MTMPDSYRAAIGSGVLWMAGGVALYGLPPSILSWILRVGLVVIVMVLVVPVYARIDKFRNPKPDDRAASGSTTDFILFRATLYCQYLCVEHKTRCMENALHTYSPGWHHSHPMVGFKDGWIHLRLHHFDIAAGVVPMMKSKKGA